MVNPIVAYLDGKGLAFFQCNCAGWWEFDGTAIVKRNITYREFSTPARRLPAARTPPPSRQIDIRVVAQMQERDHITNELMEVWCH